MPLYRSLLALALVVSFSQAAELRTLDGKTYNGEVVKITDKEVVFSAKMPTPGEVTRPIEQILHLDLGGKDAFPSDAKYTDVELNDGTILHCSSCRFQGENIIFTLLLTGQEIKLPMSAVSNILTDAQTEKYRRDWTDRIKKKGKTAILAKLNEGVVNPLPGIIGKASEDGRTIDFTLRGTGEVRAVPFMAEKEKNIHGLIFFHDLDPNAKPPLCKLHDAFRDVVMVASVEQSPDGTSLTVTTPSGAKLLYPLAKLAMLDYSNGKLVYLSDITPDRLVEFSTEDRIDHYKRDRNMDGKDPIRIQNIVYPKGLSIHADARLDFDLNGEFNVFKAVVGIDDVVGGVLGPVKLRIEADGKELYSRTFDRKTWKSDQRDIIEKNIKDVQTLRIEVTSGDLLTLGKHLVLADVKVTK